MDRPDAYWRRCDATPESVPDTPDTLVAGASCSGAELGFSAGTPGVLVSWVSPVPPGSGPDHLAAPTEDHSLTYADFAGDMALQRAEDLGDLFAPLLAKGAGSGSRR